MGGVLVLVKRLAEKLLDQGGLACGPVANEKHLHLVQCLPAFLQFSEIFLYHFYSLVGNLYWRADERVATEVKLRQIGELTDFRWKSGELVQAEVKHCQPCKLE